MRSLKRTYVLPADLLKRFEEAVPAGTRSKIITAILQEWLAKRREHLREEVIAGCRDMAAIYLEVEKQYHPLEEEVQRALASPPDVDLS
jgi:metal-responsive CopG/Arc/MetJ family transcriptional regulator